MKKSYLLLAFVTVCLIHTAAKADIYLDDGGSHLLTSPLYESVILQNGSHLTVDTGGEIIAPVDDGVRLEALTSLTVQGTGYIEGGIKGGFNGYILVTENAFIRGGYRGLSYDDGYVIVNGHATIQGGDNAFTGSEDGWSGISGGQSSPGLFVAGNAQIYGGYGNRRGGSGISDEGGAGLLTINISDSVTVKGGDGGLYGGNGLNSSYEWIGLNMTGGSIIGGYGGVNGGVGAETIGDGAGNSIIYGGLINGGDGGDSGGAGFVGSIGSMTGGRIKGGSGGLSGGTGYRYLNDISDSNPISQILDGVIIGGYGGERGGNAIDMHIAHNNLEIIGGNFVGGDSGIDGGSVIYGDTDRLDIFGGRFDAGHGDVNDGWLIEAGSYSTSTMITNIYGGHFGSENAGRGFRLWGESIFNIYGSGLSLEEDILTGWLQDGNYINVPVYFDASFTGEFNLHNVSQVLIGVAPATYNGTDYQAYYDTAANLTWLANANPIGEANWADAKAWAAGLAISGVTGWRLPDTLQPDSSCSIKGGNDSHGLNCTGSELGNLFYNVLGGVAGQSITTTHSTNYDLFSAIQASNYWSATVYEPIPTYAWAFLFEDGTQIRNSQTKLYHAWAVHDGDIRSLIDYDDDGLPDIVEDSNGNGVVDAGETDPLNPDTDGDSALDGQEDSNQNGMVDAGEPDPLNPDSDGDGLTDGYEINVGGSDPTSNTPLCANPGDMNEDGDVNLGDLLLLQRQLLGILNAP